MDRPHVSTVVPTAGARRHPILFVHGAWHGAWCWEPFQQWFAAQGWESHALDLRGHGSTPNDRSLRFTRITHYVDDLAAVVERLDRPPIIVAHSMGGLVAQRYLERAEVPGLVLLTPVPLGGVTRATFRTVRRHPVKFLKANLTLSLGPLVEDRAVAADLFLPDDAEESDIDWMYERVQPDSYLAYLDMLVFVRSRPQLVHSPVAIVAAQRDRIFGVKELRKMGRAYGVDVTVVDTAHGAMFGPRWEQAAQAVADAAESF